MRAVSAVSALGVAAATSFIAVDRSCPDPSSGCKGGCYQWEDDEDFFGNCMAGKAPPVAAIMEDFVIVSVVDGVEDCAMRGFVPLKQVPEGSTAPDGCYGGAGTRVSFFSNDETWFWDAIYEYGCNPPVDCPVWQAENPTCFDGEPSNATGGGGFGPPGGEPVGVVAATSFGADQCDARSSRFGQTCCCSQGVCAEDRYDAVAQVEPGLWTVLTRLNQVEADLGPHTNRMVIFKLPGDVEDMLVLVNGVHLCDTTLQQLHELERREHAKVRHVISPSDFHHVYLWQYNVYFPEAIVHVPPGRINVVPEALEPNLTYTLLDMDNPLHDLRPHLQVEFMRGMGRFGDGIPRNELFFFQPSTSTLLVGDFMWFFSCEPPVDSRIPIQPDVLSRSKGKITVWQQEGTSGFINLTQGVASAQLMLDLPFTRFLSVHGEQGSVVPPGASPSAWELVNEALRTGRGPLAPSMADPVAISV